MSHFPALDVVIGLSFIFFIFSLICSAVTEWIATRLEWRAKMLEVAIANLFSGSYSITTAGQTLATKFWDQPLIQSLQRPRHEKLTTKPTPNDAAASDPSGIKRPSYVPARTFVLAVLDIGAHAHLAQQTDSGEENTSENAAATGSSSAVPTLDSISLLDQINGIENEQMRNALLSLYRDAGGQAAHFRQAAEQWFDDSMERVSGWYKRRAQFVLTVTALAIVLVLNIDTLSIAQTLWRDDAARAAVVAQAEASVKNGQQAANATQDAKDLPVPVGWKLWSTGTNPEQIPNTFESIIEKILGLLITAAALTLGAPFWFDLLSKFVRVRGTGAPPPASDAVRHGEGEETRAGDPSPTPGPS
jgi:hypothetical protein